MDGDGLGGLAVSATGYNTVYVFRVTGGGTLELTANIQDAIFAAGYQLGSRLAIEPLAHNGGAALVIMGRDDVWAIPLPLTDGDIRVTEGNSVFHVHESFLNFWAFSQRDFSGDGVLDLAVSATTSGFGDNGGVEMLIGPLEGEYLLPEVADLRLRPQPYDGPVDLQWTFGAAGVPDINGDGIDDAMVALPNWDFWGRDVSGLFVRATGAVLVYTGLQNLSGVQVGAEQATLVGTCDSQLDGDHRKVLGDVTGDGLVDVAESSYYLSPAGRWNASGVFIVSLPCVAAATGPVDISTVSPAVIVGAEPADTLYVPAALGDLNDDGVDDLAIGAIFAGCCGKVYIFLGPLSGTIDAAEADLTIEGTGEDYQFGAAVEGVGDIDGDGIPDLAVGAPGSSWNNGWADSGSAYFFSGADLLDAM